MTQGAPQATPRLYWRCLLLLLIAIASEQLGTAAMKASQGFTQPLASGLAVAGSVASLYFFGRSMRALPMGFAYALWSGLGLLLAAVIGSCFFGETIRLNEIAGLLLVIAGVIVLNWPKETS